jgi:hypothetical protein
LTVFLALIVLGHFPSGPSTAHRIGRLQLEWAGHVWRAGESVIRNVLIRNPTKKRPMGRPRQWWLDRVKKDISDTDETKQLEDAMDRNIWRSLVEACKRP